MSYSFSLLCAQVLEGPKPVQALIFFCFLQSKHWAKGKRSVNEVKCIRVILSETLIDFLPFFTSNYDQYSVVCRPWITIDGDTSQRLLRMFREMVLMLILGNPGISQVRTSEQ